MDELDEEVDNYEEYERDSEGELEANLPPNQEPNLFCVENPILSNSTFGEPILSIRMPQRRSKRRKR